MMSLAAAQFDLPPRQATHALVICATARSGSTYLAHRLAGLGYGVADEYLNPGPAFRPALQRRLRAADLHAYLQHVVALRTGAAGVFSIELFPWHLRAAGINLADLLALLPGATRVLHLARDDQVDQAVSTLIAQQTGAWQYNAVDPQRSDIHYRPRVISRIARRAADDNAHWARAIAALDVPAARIKYEALRADPAATLQQVIDLVGADPVPVDLQLPEIVRWGSDIKAAWAQRYRAERGLNGV